MKTTVLLILGQFVNAMEREVMTITPTNVQTQKNVVIESRRTTQLYWMSCSIHSQAFRVGLP